MDIVMVGSGNVAHYLGRLLKEKGCRIRQVYSRGEMHARTLAGKLDAAWTSDLDQLDRRADIYLLAVTDAAISRLNRELRLGERMVAHTAGAVPLEAIHNISTHTGVFYPLQSIRKELVRTGKIPLLIEGNNQAAREKLQSLAAIISDKVVETTSSRRLKMHLAAVFCNNFTNFMLTLCEDYCKGEQLDFSLLKPMIQETFLRLEKMSPGVLQTGPAVRGDTATMQKHLDLLESYPGMEEIYRLLSSNIEAYYDQRKFLKKSQT